MFYIWRTNRMTLFCNLVTERPLYSEKNEIFVGKVFLATPCKYENNTQRCLSTYIDSLLLPGNMQCEQFLLSFCFIELVVCCTQSSTGSSFILTVIQRATASNHDNNSALLVILLYLALIT